ncbi:MAG: hypothetical protein IPJ17_12945 [Holophagales bacterium]|nr:MAG: hypothetical protein IPJ17_12945 [Holophagales bacterium]
MPFFEGAVRTPQAAGAFAGGCGRLWFRHVGCAALVVASLANGGCAKDPNWQRNRLRELRAEQTEIADTLYREYGGAPIAKAVSQSGAESTNSTMARARELLTGAVAEVDRSLFEAYLVEIGEGKRAPALSAEAREFFARREVKKSARRFVQLGDEIRDLERKLSRPPSE